MVADEYATRGIRMWRPPANAEDMLVEVRKNLLAKLAPYGHIDLQGSGSRTS